MPISTTKLSKVSQLLRFIRMDCVKDVVVKPLNEPSRFLKPKRMHFTHNGKSRTWDLISIHDSVAILLFNVTKKKLIFVKQFRPPVYYGTVPEEGRHGTIDVTKYPPDAGITLELCAGLVDKDMPLEQIAKEEVLEECGYDVPLKNFVKIGDYKPGVGSLATSQTAYYCEITEDMHVGRGGGVEDEIIEVVELTLPEIQEYIMQSNVPSPPSVMFAVYWFLYHKAGKIDSN